MAHSSMGSRGSRIPRSQHMSFPTPQSNVPAAPVRPEFRNPPDTSVSQSRHLRYDRYAEVDPTHPPGLFSPRAGGYMRTEYDDFLDDHGDNGYGTRNWTSYQFSNPLANDQWADVPRSKPLPRIPEAPVPTPSPLPPPMLPQGSLPPQGPQHPPNTPRSHGQGSQDPRGNPRGEPHGNGSSGSHRGSSGSQHGTHGRDGHRTPAPVAPEVSSYTVVPPAVPNLSGCMSMLTAVEILKRSGSRQTLMAWESSVMNILYTANLAGHVVCYDNVGAAGVSALSAEPIYPPEVDPIPTPAQRSAFLQWRRMDAAAYQIVVARIDADLLASLPPSLDGSPLTARQAMKEILRVFAAHAFVDTQKVVNDLRAVRCTANVNAYLLRWTKDWIQVMRDGTYWGVRDATFQFLSKLPSSYYEFCLDQTRVLDRVADHDKQHLLNVIRLVSEREVARGMLAAHSATPRHVLPSSSLPCENCGITGHSQAMCFKPGGGRDGQAPPRKARPGPNPNPPSASAPPKANVAIDLELGGEEVVAEDGGENIAGPANRLTRAGARAITVAQKVNVPVGSILLADAPISAAELEEYLLEADRERAREIRKQASDLLRTRRELSPFADPSIPESLLSSFMAYQYIERSEPELAYAFADIEEQVLRDACLAAYASDGSSWSLATGAFDLSKPPATYQEMMMRPDRDKWIAACERELASLKLMGAFVPAHLPDGRKAIQLRWVFAFKYRPDGSIIEGAEKARLVAKGFSQRPEDYGEVSSPVARTASIRTVFAYAAREDLELMAMDVKTAFLHAKLDRDIYVQQPPGFPLADRKMVLKLLVALYGLKQAAYEFYQLVRRVLADIGMLRCEVDHAVFCGEWTSPPDPSIPMPSDGKPLRLIFPIHVDDGAGAASNRQLWSWFIGRLRTVMDIKDLGPIELFLGMQVLRDRASRRLWLSQRSFTVDLLQDWNMTNCKPVSTPLEANINLFNLPVAPPNSLPDIKDSDITVRYQSLVGSLLYLACTTRADLAYTAMALGQFNSKPTRALLLVAKRVLRYLAGTVDHALELGVRSSSSPLPNDLSPFSQFVGCSDSDWGSDASDRRSVSGFAFFYVDSLVAWSATKQRSVALSTTEAEYYALTNATKEALWLRSFLSFCKMDFPSTTTVFSDNQAAVSLSVSPSISSRSKHIDIRYHFLRQHVLDGILETRWIPTTNNPADLFTKALSFPNFSRHLSVLRINVPPSSLPVLVDVSSSPSSSRFSEIVD
ncbi:hypothetical protein CVT24_004199 [Panaeolus cyanescens]|uniref:Reverse transcriptase Ty1/copia-type domain-containing protein n=1 Tax=Panaeolus cyanescens TaxID=181874 RepID=A0A409WSZ3_9AGAR|nr:hypothetical protein CVT24_004199 [Panaeolus cyanescens]